MGVVRRVLPGTDRSSVAPLQLPHTSHITYHKMHLRLVLLVALLLLGTCISSPVLSGTGGVFNSPEANAYWARRFGRGFGGLRSVMESINAAAAANRFSRP